MTLGITGITDSLQSHAVASGLFETVNLHEPKSKPDNGVTCAIWADRIGPARGASGLASTTALVVMAVRLYTPMLQQPYDGIDTAMLGAVDTLMAAYSDDFTLEGQIRDIDLLGQFGTPLSAQAGYVSQDNKLFRVMTISVPMVVNDLWVQSP